MAKESHYGQVYPFTCLYSLVSPTFDVCFCVFLFDCFPVALSSPLLCRIFKDVLFYVLTSSFYYFFFFSVVVCTFFILSFNLYSPVRTISFFWCCMSDLYYSCLFTFCWYCSTLFSCVLLSSSTCLVVTIFPVTKKKEKENNGKSSYASFLIPVQITALPSFPCPSFVSSPADPSITTSAGRANEFTYFKACRENIMHFYYSIPSP